MLLAALSTVSPSFAAPLVGVSGTLPYTFTAFCADPIGESVIFGITTCNSIDIDYTATGVTSLSANTGLNLQTFLNPELPGPFPFTGSFVLTDLDNPADTIFGTLTGAGNVAGPPGPPIGFPPFAIELSMTATGGTGALAGSTGSLYLAGTAIFTAINTSGTFASGEGTTVLSSVPEPASGSLMVAVGALALLSRRLRSRR
ncbi:MAG: PEP-CTERM sorting domain-containing protein [Bryobacteraceae bacterium]|nr:PEP-CTERM sorting domain-containing protein [Bryobacteraceae bacterium]